MTLKFNQLTIACGAIAVIILSGCRTTEANYRAAYEAARSHAEAKSDSTTDRLIARESYSAHIIDGNDTIPMIGKLVKITEGCNAADESGAYGIVVAEFRQRFNAKSMMERLRTSGYEGAIVVETGEPLYYVVAATASTPVAIASAYRRIKKAAMPGVKAPYPLAIRIKR